ncbi:dockerin type I domain-containing protein [Clostridium cellulovorans]|uniref:dockerin type I domain-containing protein n=1 Tax=Clostridium cellulovorans TaxID=1493 RepID=UPI0001A97019|nr:dockerin type I domain-containing protein [Clostridium cellulovorans]
MVKKRTKTWTPLTDWVDFQDWNLLGCESMAADPVETNRVYIAVGTYNNDWTDMNGDKVVNVIDFALLKKKLLA